MKELYGKVKGEIKTKEIESISLKLDKAIVKQEKIKQDIKINKTICETK